MGIFGLSLGIQCTQLEGPPSRNCSNFAKLAICAGLSFATIVDSYAFETPRMVYPLITKYGYRHFEQDEANFPDIATPLAKASAHPRQHFRHLLPAA